MAGDLVSTRNRRLRTTLGLTAARLVVAVGGMATLVVATRALGTAAFGAWATAMAVTSLLVLAMDLGLTTVGARELTRAEGQRSGTLATLAVLSLSLGFTAAGVGALLAQSVYPGADGALVRHALAWMLCALPVNGLIVTLNARLIAAQRAFKTGVAAAIGAVASVAIAGLTVVFAWGLGGIVGAYLVGTVVSACALYAMSRPVDLSFREADRATAKSLLLEALPLGGSNALSAAYQRADLLMLSVLASNTQLAYYAVAYRVVDVSLMLAAYVFVPFLPELSRVVPSSVAGRKLMNEATRTMEYLSWPFVAGVLGFAPEIVRVLGGPQLGGAEAPLRILATGVALAHLRSILGNSMVAFDAQRVLVRLMVVILAVNVGLNLVVIPRWGSIGAACVYAASEALGLACQAFLFRRIAPLPRPNRMLAVFTGSVAAGLIGALAHGVWGSPMRICEAALAMALAAAAIAVGVSWHEIRRRRGWGPATAQDPDLAA
jgi:O-antigen/teichoic acid export membrane protein